MQNTAVRDFDDESPQYAVARDLARFDPRSRVRDAIKETPAYQKAVSKPRAKAAARVYMRVSPFAAASFLGAAALLLLIVFSCMQISVINIENNRLSRELNQLKTEEKQLGRGQNGSVDLGKIESYAQYELGMVKPDREHIVYIDLSGKDRGIVYDEGSFLKSLGKAASGIWEWLCDVFG